MYNLQLEDVPRSKSQARHSYDRMSRIYDWMAGSSEWRLTRAGLDMLNPQPGQRILEIGAGTGRALLYLSQQVGPAGAVIGLDLSVGMLRVAQRRLHNKAVHHNFTLIQADGFNPPLANHLFDAVFFSFTLELFDTPELSPLLERCRRMLKPNGRLQVIALARPTPPGLPVRIYEFFHRLLPTFVDCRPIPTLTLLSQAGFAIHSSDRISMWGLPVDVICAQRPA
jgi:demethylmenaquinone methyltransferase/2-methoxy-6-polyprenyl-1,4-benzoquinol methylase